MIFNEIEGHLGGRKYFAHICYLKKRRKNVALDDMLLDIESKAEQEKNQYLLKTKIHTEEMKRVNDKLKGNFSTFLATCTTLSKIDIKKE
jgi:hypothetical protein